MQRMNRRRVLLGLSAMGTLAMAPWTRAQAPAKLPRVVTVTFGSPYNARKRIELFRKGMLELGYEDGTNVRLEWRSANGQPDLMREIAQALARQNVDVIVSSSPTTTQALLQATKTIPVVMATSDDPVAAGFVKSLARPDSNATGLSANSIEQIPRYVELLVRAIPGLLRIAALMNPANVFYAGYRTRLEAAARTSRLRLVVADATTSHEIERAFSELESQRIGALVVMSDGLFYTERKFITELADRFRLPAIYPHQGYSDAGGLMSWAPNLEYNYYRAATFVDKILRGANPADLPIEQPGNHELIVNRNIAKAIGLNLPGDFVKRARKVIG